MTTATGTGRRTKRVRRRVTTTELAALLAQGHTVYLPEVARPEPEVLEHYPEADVARLEVPAGDNPVVSVDYVRDEPVQCISVAHERHLYLTDDFIPTHNTANIVFLKSTDDAMIETLQKMSGTKHEVYRDSKSITRDVSKLGPMKNEGRVTYNMAVKEIPVISYNDLAYLPARNSIVFSAGAPPIWNRNETILPMSFALFGGNPQDYRQSKTICQPGKVYSLQTIPTLSSALEFDVRLNQPNFFQMVEKRMAQATVAPAAEAIYREAYGYGDFDMARLDPDVASGEIMDINDVILARKLYDKATAAAAVAESNQISAGLEEIFGEGGGPELPDHAAETMDDFGYDDMDAVLASQAEQTVSRSTENTDLAREVADQAVKREASGRRIYAEGMVSRDMLIDPDGGAVLSTLDAELAAAYAECARDFEGDEVFMLSGESLLLRATGEPMITAVDESGQMQEVAGQAAQAGGRIHMEEEPDPDSMSALSRYRIRPGFKKALAGMDSWENLAGGQFDRYVAEQMKLAEQ